MPIHMGDRCVCVEYVVDSRKRQEETMNMGRQSPSSFRQVSYELFSCRQGRETNGLKSPSEGPHQEFSQHTSRKGNSRSCGERIKKFFH